MGCIRKAKAVQTEVSHLKSPKNKSRNRSDLSSKIGNQSSRTIRSHLSDARIISSPNLKQNSDIQDPAITPRSNYTSRRVTGRTKDKGEQIAEVVFQNEDMNEQPGIFPKLKKQTRNNTATNLYESFKTPRVNSSEDKLFSPSRKPIRGTEDEKTARLQSIYSESKKFGFIKKIHKDPVTGERIIRGKGGLKDMIRNATARR